MLTQKLSYLLLLAVAIFFTACGGENNESTDVDETEETEISSQTETESGDPKTVEEAMAEARKALHGGGEAKEVVNFRDLKDLLPAKMLGLERTDFSGEKAGMFGFNIAKAEADYREDDKTIEVAIVDVAGVSAAMMGMASWATIEVDRESNDGYERTTTIDGNKAFEKYNTYTKAGELNVIVKERFIVSIKGKNVDEDELRKVLDKINVKKLGRLVE